MLSTDERADALRLRHTLPAGEPPVAVIARALAGKDGIPLLDAELLRQGDATQIAALLALLGQGRASLSGNVTVTSRATLTNTGLSTLDVPVVAGERYRIEYTVQWSIAGATSGAQFGLEYPAYTAAACQIEGVVFEGGAARQPMDLITSSFADDYANPGSGGAFIQVETSAANDFGNATLVFDIIPSASGTVKLLAGQFASSTNELTIYRMTSVNWVKF